MGHLKAILTHIEAILNNFEAFWNNFSFQGTNPIPHSNKNNYSNENIRADKIKKQTKWKKILKNFWPPKRNETIRIFQTILYNKVPKWIRKKWAHFRIPKSIEVSMPQNYQNIIWIHLRISEKIENLSKNISKQRNGRFSIQIIPKCVLFLDPKRKSDKKGITDEDKDAGN